MPKLGPNTKANVFKAVNGYTEDHANTSKTNIGEDNENRAKFLRESVTPDNIIGVIKGLDGNSEGILTKLSTRKIFGGTTIGQALCNRIPKALMQKAIAMKLTNTNAYKDLEKFYGSKYNANQKTLTFAKNDDANKTYNQSTAQEADKLIRALAEEIIKNS